MKEENRSEIIHDALNLLDDEMIEEVDKLRGGVLMEKKPRSWRKWVALAASICLLIVAFDVWDAQHRVTLESADQAIDLELNGGSTNQGSLTDDEESKGADQGNVQEEESFDYAGNVDDAEAELPESTGAVGNSDSAQDLPVQESDQEAFGANLENYKAVYYMSKEKWQNIDADDVEAIKRGREIIPEKNRATVEKFLLAFQNSEKVCIVEYTSWEDIEKDAEHIYHLFVERSDGTTVHLVLFGEGHVCYYGAKSIWAKVDMEAYEAMVDILENQ